MRGNYIFSVVSAGGVLFVLLLFAPLPADALTTVDCDADSQALEDEIVNGNDFEYEVDGTCAGGTDNVIRVSRSLRLIDDNTTPGILDTDIVIAGSFGEVFFNDLEIGGSDAKNVFVQDNARAYFTNIVFGNTINAPSLLVLRNAHVNVHGSTFFPITSRDLSADGPFCTAVCVGDNSFAIIRESSIEGQEDDATIGSPVQAFRDSSLRLQGGNTITNNGSTSAVGIFYDSSLRSDISGSSTNDVLNGGLEVFGESFADVRATDINGDTDNDAVFVGGSSTFEANAAGNFGSNGVTIEGMDNQPLVARDGSLVDMDDDTTANNGTVICEDSTQLVNDGFGGDASVDCDNFYVDDNGRVGIGSRTPTNALHVRRDGGGSSVAALKLDNPNGKLRFVLASSGEGWTFNNANGNAFTIAKIGTGARELEVDSNGNLTIEGTLTEKSSRSAKTSVEAVEPAQVLDKLAGLPLSEWTYTDGSARHLGPMAEDFHAAFGLGRDAKHIAPKDLAGVALTAAQQLYERSQQLSERNQQLSERNEKLRADTEALQARMEEQKLKVENQKAALQSMRHQQTAQKAELAELRNLVEALAAEGQYAMVEAQ